MTTATTPAMINDAGRLADALHPLATAHPDIHTPIVRGMAASMCRDGVIEFRVSDLARRVSIPFRQVKQYLHTGRRMGLLELVGRRLESGHVRYAAYAADPRSPQHDTVPLDTAQPGTASRA